MEHIYENGKVKIKAMSLVLIIQAVDDEIQALMPSINERMTPEDQQFLEDYVSVAEELKSVYEEAYKEIINLPSYEKLVKETTYFR